MSAEIVFTLAMIALAVVAYAALRGSSRFFWTAMFVVLVAGIVSGIVHLMQRG